MEQDGPVPEAWHWEWIGDGGKMFLGEYFGIGNAPLATPRGLPFGYVDTVGVSPGTVSVAGWAIDPDQVGVDPGARVRRRDRVRPSRPTRAGPT